MEISACLLSAAIWMFIFRKMPSWSWFKSLLEKFPHFLRKLWDGWTECAYCGGFWVALGVRYLTGLKTIHLSGETPLALNWVLDALTTGIGVLLFIRILDALAPVIRSDQTKH